MPFTEEQRYQTLTFLNQALLRTDQMRAQSSDYSGDFYRFDATLTPTEYQKNRPVPLLFQKDDIWARMDAIENEAEYLVEQVQGVLDGLQTQERAIASERSSPNSALKRADVLEWEVGGGGRSAGMFAQRDNYVENLRYFLNLPPSPDPTGGSGGMLLRS
ncbi:hypothetical protein [Nostoc sp. FACHB-110]|uniref:hypothetical protein n=1 Tax=Nostoc sp. FACHB-110 TaxID=2692834 RepID=UPI0016851D80|nr:hypothetical protein [Nostoc sp. FACHB-110]MBD2437342.1 hypothetical protein [Nostoc sp. FACHB-110]